MSEPYDYKLFDRLKELACRCVGRKGSLAKILEEEGVKVCFAELAMPIHKFCEYQFEAYRAKSGKCYFKCEYSNESPKGNGDSDAH